MRISTITKEHVTNSAAKPADYEDQTIEREARVTLDSPGDRKVWIELDEPGQKPLAISVSRAHDGTIRLFVTDHAGLYLFAPWIDDSKTFAVPPRSILELRSLP